MSWQIDLGTKNIPLTLAVICIFLKFECLLVSYSDCSKRGSVLCTGIDDGR